MIDPKEIYVLVSDLHTREKPIGYTRIEGGLRARVPVGQDIAHGAPFVSNGEV